MVSIATSVFFSSIRKKNRKAKAKAKNRRKKKQKKESNRHITEELLQEEILVRLPVKSLVKFKSVSKSWQSLIQSPSFIDFYRRRRCHDYSAHLLISPHATTFNALLKKKKPLSLATDSIKIALSPSDLHLPPKTTPLKPPESGDEKWRRTVRVLGPLSNGIYCLVSYLHMNFNRISGIKIALCNPATRDYKFANSFPHDSRLLLTRLARRPCRVHYGFGNVHRCSFRVDYKVVVVFSWGIRFGSFMCFVYSLRDGEWRRVVDYERGVRHFVKGKIVKDGFNTQGLMIQYPEIVEDLEMCPQRFFKRCWHWMALRYDGMYCVLSFDLAEDVFGLMEGPPGYFEYNATGTIDVKGGVLVLNDHLAAVYLSHPVVLHAWQCIDIDVWMMMEYGVEESWTKIYAIKPDFYGRFTRLVGISWLPVRDGSGDGDGNCIERMFFEDDSKRLISCGDSGCKEHGVCDISSYICWNTLGVSTYMETLQRLSC